MKANEVIKKVLDEHGEITEVYWVACGGSLIDLYPSHFLMNVESAKTSSGWHTAKEFLVATPKKLGKHSLVVMCSHSGNTKEAVDAAVLAYTSDKEVLVTTDLLLEGIHFDVRYVPLKHLGYKAAVVNFSDIYAMMGRPRQITVSIGVSARFTVEHLDQIYSGIRLACERYGVDLVGGDTSASASGSSAAVGSSSTRSLEPCESAVTMDSFVRVPLDISRSF